MENENTFEREVLERLTRIEVRLDGYGNLKNTVYENEKQIIKHHNDIADVKEEIAAMKEDNKWLKRTTISAIIVAVVGIVINYLIKL